MGKKTPKAPDPAQTAAAQGAWNSFTAQQQQQMNMIGQNSPWGSLSYDQTGSTTIIDPSGRRVEVPMFTANTQLSPQQQAVYDQNQAAELNLATVANEQSGRIGALLNDPFTYNNRDAENWAYDLASQRILPQQEQNRQALENQLVNSGIRRGTAAWDQEMARMTNANTDQMNQLALTGRSQGFSEALAQRNQPLNEIIGLMSGTQIQNPNATFAQTPQSQVAGVDYAGLVQQNYQNQVNANAAKTGALGGLFGGIASMMPFSDERLKENIVPVGETEGGTNLYEYNYIADPFDTPQVGVMAQEVPEARVEDPSGFYRVDYSKVK